jgi:hypothetical protein
MSEINVNVSGEGRLNIGNLAQGQDVNISSGVINQAESSAALVTEILRAVRGAAGGNDSRVQAVEGRVQELGNALTAEPRNTGKIKEILGTIKQHHDWAFPAIATIVEKVAPALATLL